MFYAFEDGVKKTTFGNLKKGVLAAGCVTADELRKIAPRLGYAESTVEACLNGSEQFRSAVEIYSDYTFTELRVASLEDPETDDGMAIYIGRDLFLLVDVFDSDRSTVLKFERAVSRFAERPASLEKLVYAFFDELTAQDVKTIESLGREASDLEEDVMAERPEKDFNQDVFRLKKKLQRMHNLYEQYLDILEVLDADENELFGTETLLYLMNLEKRVTRLREDVDSISNEVVHVQDAYRSLLDMKMNRNMNFLTVIGTIFFPLTIIVGWYGMNFESMPEFKWKYGYLFVILLSVSVITAAYLIAKRKKWF